MFGGDDDLLHGAVASEVAVPGDDLNEPQGTSIVFSSIIRSLASTRQYSITRRSLWSPYRLSDHYRRSLFCVPETKTNPESLESECSEGSEGGGEAERCYGEVVRCEEEWFLGCFFMVVD